MNHTIVKPIGQFEKRLFCFNQTSSAAQVKQVTSLVKAVKLETGAFYVQISR
jgi:hypothetical protein